MNFLTMLANDPVVMFAIGGLTMLLAIGGYYIYYFLKHINEGT